MLVVPVAPYTRAMPYRKNAEANPPSTKYLRPDSALWSLRRLLDANTYSASDNVSSPRNSTIRSFAEAMTTPPIAATR
jgi:hypothetical protein